jgi:transposase
MPRQGSQRKKTKDRNHYKKWNKEDLSSALCAVKEKRLSYREAAKRFHIPKSTLFNYINGISTPDKRPGPPPPLLDKDEEEKIVDWIKDLAAHDMAPTRCDVERKISKYFEEETGKSYWVTSGWWQRFFHRHPELASRRSEALSLERSRAFSIPKIIKHFKDLIPFVTDDSPLKIPPSQIFNCDETGIEQHEKSNRGFKVIIKKGMRHARSRTANCSRDHISILSCISADGRYLPPFYILQGKNFCARYLSGAVPGTGMQLSNKGWITDELFFFEWIKWFIQLIPPARPALLIFDGHGSHVSLSKL